MRHTSNSHCVLLEDTDWHNINLINRSLFDFYLLNCPYAKSDKSTKSSSTAIDLSTNGWTGIKLNQLMQWISANFFNEEELCFVYRVSNNVNETIQDFELNAKHACVSHPRCVLHINNKVSVSESGVCKVKLTETYITCLFRHIRNAFAHSNFAIKQDGRLLLLDTSSKPNTSDANKKYTFGMVTDIDFLINLKELVEAGPSDTLVTEDMRKKLAGKSYRIKFDKEVILETQQEDDQRLPLN